MGSGVVSGATVASAALLVSGLLWWGSADVVAGGDPENAATALVPADGTRVVDRDDGGVSVSEEARLTGPEMVLTSPPLVGGALATILDGDPYAWRIWRTTLTTYDVEEGASGEQSTTLRRLTDRGVEQLADYGAFTLVFDPPLLELPADVHAGSTWSSSGSASTDGELAYSSELSAEAADRPGCLRVTGTVDFTSAGTELFTSDADDTWCEGEGIVAHEATDPPSFDGPTDPQVALASGAETWEVHERPTVIASSVAEAADTGGVASLIVDLAPAANRYGGVSVANAQGDDVVGLVRSGDQLVRAWVGHPGGTVTSVATAGDVTVASTSRRELVAYGARGEWLWSRRLDDVPATAPLVVDEDHLVATTVGGEVVGIDPASGEQLWAHDLSDQVRMAPVTDGETVVAADIAGRVAAYDVDDGDLAWSVELDPVAAAAVVGDVVVVRTDTVATALDLTTGARVWTTPVDGGTAGAAVVDLGTSVGVADAEDTRALDVETGHQLWRASGATTTVGLDRTLAQVEDHRLVVRDDEGEVLGRWRLSGLRGDTDFVSPSDIGLWVMDAVGTLVEVGP